MSTALLFDHREVDEVDWSESLPRLGRSAVLWIDLEGPDDGELERLADVLDLDSRAIERRENPEFADYGDHIIASTGQRTNEIMKFLTLASVLILPGTLIAGVMGMNFKLGIFETAAYFWLVLVAMLVVALVTLAIARMRDWI